MHSTDLRTRRLALSRAWERMVGGDPLPSEPAHAGPGASLPERLLQSWQRSQAGLDPELEAAPVDDTDSAVHAWRRTSVAAGLRAVEADVRRTVDDADLVAAVTDATGRIVWTHGSRVMQRRAEQVNFVPGGHWDEASVGTNALALALRDGAPSTVYSAEHFSRAVHGWVCYSVPLTEAGSGRVLGVLDLSTTWDRAHPLVLGTATLLASMVMAGVPAQRPAPGTGLVELRVLGGWDARLAGRPLPLPRRQLEVLLLLALHPEGLSLESLHDRLYGEERVSTATLKAEVSHLRRALSGQVGSRPYRVTTAVDSDLQQALRTLDGGDPATAVALARGPLLPGSQSPEVLEWRAYLDVALRSAALGSADVALVRAVADRAPYDLALQEHLERVLPRGDARAATARARVLRAGLG